MVPCFQLMLIDRILHCALGNTDYMLKEIRRGDKACAWIVWSKTGSHRKKKRMTENHNVIQGMENLLPSLKDFLKENQGKLRTWWTKTWLERRTSATQNNITWNLWCLLPLPEHLLTSLFDLSLWPTKEGRLRMETWKGTLKTDFSLSLTLDIDLKQIFSDI